MQHQLAALAAICLASCASIVSKSSYGVMIDTDPPGADIEVADRSGEIIFRGSTPTILTLPAGKDFKPARYTLTSGEWSQELVAGTDAAFMGNVLLGFAGILGVLIDGTTGAMFILPDSYKLLLYVPEPEEPEPEPKSFGDPDATRF